MSKTNNNNNLKLEQNGRVFPSWIMKNFKKLTLLNFLADFSHQGDYLVLQEQF